MPSRSTHKTPGVMIAGKKLDDIALDEPEVFVGKDVLELLSSSMYVNPLSVFREYVQNAADAIDDAVAAGLLPSIDAGRIEIKLDHIDRRVIVRDNGSGLANKDFPSRMLSFGASAKRGTDARGFRGVGRLSALGYAQQLIFRSRAKGDTEVLEVVWDGHAVKRMLASIDADADLRATVKEAISLRRHAPDNYPSHFFEVEMIKPRRIANDRLLNEADIMAFISQVCPCPFSPEFSFGPEISALLTRHGRAGKTYNIYINDAEMPVYRPYRNEVGYSGIKTSALNSPKQFTIEGIDGGIAAIGWFSHHDYQGAIPVAQGVRGLRARVGNIQVGHDRIFLEIFPEDRFCSWCIGEVHVLDARIVPNGRRDDFEANAHLDNIIAHLRPIGVDVARECRISSRKRNRQKNFQSAEDKIYAKLGVLQQGAVSKSYATTIMEEVRALLSEMRKIVEFDLLNDEDRRTLQSKLKKTEKAVTAITAKAEVSTLKSLPAGKQRTYKEVFDLIYDCSVNQGAAKSLVDSILERLSKS